MQKNTKFTPLQDFSVGGILHQAWGLITGTKGPIWFMMIIILFIFIMLSSIFTNLLNLDLKAGNFFINSILLPIVINWVIAPFYAGAIMVAVKRARGETVSLSTGLGYFHQFLSIAITAVFINILSSLPIILLTAPYLQNLNVMYKTSLEFVGGFLSVLIYTFLMLSIPLLIDKKLKPLAAIKQSINTIKPRWFTPFLCILLGYLFFSMIFLPVYIGIATQNFFVLIFGTAILVLTMIWMVPFMVLIQGVIYNALVLTKK